VSSGDITGYTSCEGEAADLAACGGVAGRKVGGGRDWRGNRTATTVVGHVMTPSWGRPIAR
jgi:hypothetical protein